jgi:hypothetical protein
MSAETLWIIIGMWILLNFVVTIYICKRDDLNRFQKVAQSILVWLIPIFAAIGLWVFHRNSDKNDVKHMKNGNSVGKDSGYYASQTHQGDL